MFGKIKNLFKKKEDPKKKAKKLNKDKKKKRSLKIKPKNNTYIDIELKSGQVISGAYVNSKKTIVYKQQKINITDIKKWGYSK
jgi:hypothetical protein